MSSYTYDVPELSDFTDNISSENYAEIESYFDISHEDCNGAVLTQVFTVDAHNSLSDDSEGSDVRDPLHTSLRRSSSVGDLQTFVRNRTQINEHQSHLLKDAVGTSFCQSNSTISLLQSKKFVSVAEAISTFHNKTPDRFHSRSRMLKPSFASGAAVKQCTVPASPFLATKQRARPTTVLSHDEKEIKEAEEMHKFKIKANPLNPKILARPSTPKVGPVRKSTVPQPFNITQAPKRKPVTPVPIVPTFHAQPMPKFLPRGPLVKPQTPIIVKRDVEKKCEVKLKKSEEIKLKNTVPLPFSFLERDKDLLRKKDDALKKLFESEKRNREFHANPLPKYLSSADGANSTMFKRNMSVNVSKHSSTESLVQPIFKAKPAKVLNMKPFEPKKEERLVLEVAEFRLNTDLRAKEREAFQSKLKEKEHLLHEYIKRKEEENHQKEAEEVRRLRKQTEYRAQPIRKYKEVAEVEHKKLTIPVSPKFNRNHSNKENLSS
ncbi:hypothetical protein PPYR_11936 [Photinus pyralis]|uniref:TPX2 C-terminal domain-containing protein n=1 Tax=Photinus pyralis TaxID=7054 RepID=A0A1Y1LQG8_PHOPY|nr:targeting protein for Xklp2-like [Photinus pyralis]XP_031352413.1 targeting protein for Xklp2-like [Photinus pyralis]KAB0795097.1 hypothetical protein PPYR_11936 [Photinus pyralis]